MDRQVMEGFPVTPMCDYIFVADLGQPTESEGGIIIPVDSDRHSRYRAGDWRYGVVCAIGPGRVIASGKLCGRVKADLPAMIEEGLRVGCVVVFNRRVGTRMPVKFQPPGVDVPLFVRVLDPMKVEAIVDDFKPWWNIADGVLDPSRDMSG